MGTTVNTEYGQVATTDNGWAHVTAHGAELQAWATRPGASWPCSTLAKLSQADATFTRNGDLVDFEAYGSDGQPIDADVAADEFSAWTTDTLTLAGLATHPACRTTA